MERNRLVALMHIIARIRKGEVDESHLLKELDEVYIKSEEKAESHDYDVETIRRLRIQNKKIQALVLTLKEQVKEMRENRNQLLHRINDLRRLNKSLAASLGSCHLCWGEDETCLTCGGAGAPGWKTVNSRLFNIFILPVLEKKYGINFRQKKR